MTIFKLPDLGEGLPDAQIREWHIKVGDTVKTDQVLVSMETAKAVVEVPSPHDGIIKTLYGDVGDIIETDAPLIEFDTQSADDAGTVAGKIEVGHDIVMETATVLAGAKAKAHAQGKTTPAVRALAAKLNVDLSHVSGTGPNGMITVKDVKAFQQPTQTSTIANAEPLSGTRRSMAQVMALAHQQIVPVTVVDEADIHAWDKKEDILCRIIRALCVGIQAEGALNAWFDGKNLSRRVMDSVHLGLAMDSEEGLFVPVLRDVDKTIIDPASCRSQVESIKTQVKARTIPQEQLQDATITLSNFGVFAGRYASPVIIPPQVAILATGKIRNEAVVVDEKIQAHRMMPLSLTVDHRAVTGGEATRFLAAVIEDLHKAQ